MKNEIFYGEKWDKISVEEFISIIEYSRAAEPPVQCGVSHLSRRTEPHCL